MSSMVSIILVFMLTIGGSPVVPGNSVDSFNISEKPLLGAKKISPGIRIKKITENQHPIKEKQILNLKLHRDLYYGYNKVQMKTFEQRLHDSGKGNVMAYDDIYRLTNMKFNAPDPTIENPTTFEKEKAINLDHLHNILSIVENYNGQSKTITTDIPENSVYSKLNQYASFDKWGLDYDKKGNTTQRGTQQLAYDYRNQLVTANDAPSNTQVEMKYDVLGRRTQKSVTIGSQSKIENYYHSGQQVIEVRDENDQVLRQYIYGNGIDEIIRMDKFEGDTFTSYYYHTDANGSVTAITDANGQLVERVTYDIYGMPTFWDAAGNKISKSSIGNNILFHGREYDAELNLYYFRARYYDPIMGKFLQTDPMGYQDSLNLYQGFNMNPYNFADPWGLNLKLSGSEMQQFEYNLTNILIDLYRENYDAETADLLIDFAIHTATLENKVWAFNRLTGSNLEVPEKLGVLGKIFGAAKSYANFSKQVGEKVKQWLGADKAQERIDSAEDHWLVQEGVTLPGQLTIGDQLNLAFAKGAGTIAELTTEELQWAIVAGVAGKIKKLDDLVDANKAKKVAGPSGKKSLNKYLNKRWDKATFNTVEQSIEYHYKKHVINAGKDITIIELTQIAERVYRDTKAFRRIITDRKGRKAVKIISELGEGLYTTGGKIIWFHPN
jgi:RHS repeat-associated protein